MAQQKPKHVIVDASGIDNLITDLRTLAAFLGLPVPKLKQWIANGYLPVGVSRGFYSLTGCTKAYINKLASSEPADSFNAQKTRLTRIRADLVELQRAERAGQMVDVDVALRWFASIASVIKQRARGMPSKLAMRLAGTKDPLEVQRILETEIEEIFAPAEKLKDRRGLVAGVGYDDDAANGADPDAALDDLGGGEGGEPAAA
jgi:phage terminase Nu1 subunit (DNA packaging protein)